MNRSLVLTAAMLLLLASVAGAGWDYGLRPVDALETTIVATDNALLRDVKAYLNSSVTNYVSAPSASLGTAYGIRELGQMDACLAFVDEDVRDDVLVFLNSGGTSYDQVITVVDTTAPPWN